MKKIVLVLVLCLAASGAAFSQTVGSMANMEFAIVNGYNLDTTTLQTGFAIGLAFPLANNLEVGFLLVDGDGVNLIDMKLIKFSAYMSSKVGFSIATGASAGNNLALGFGIFVDLLKKKDGLQSAFQVQLNYTYVSTENESGTLGLCVAAKFGM